MIKLVLGIGIAAAATLLLLPPAKAQNAPWCAHYDFGSDESVNCSFYSFQQCVAEVRGIGGFCSQNSTYQPARAPRRR
jgi:hypothetical protein